MKQSFKDLKGDRPVGYNTFRRGRGVELPIRNPACERSTIYNPGRNVLGHLRKLGTNTHFVN